MVAPPPIRARNLRKSYGDVVAVAALDCLGLLALEARREATRSDFELERERPRLVAKVARALAPLTAASRA